MLSDFVFVVPATAGLTCYLSRLIFATETLELSIADENDITMASLSVDLSAHVTNQVYSLSGLGIYEGARGALVLGDLSNLMYELPYGSFSFTAETAPFETRTIRPDLRGVQQLQVISSDGIQSPPLTGIVKLVAGQNVRLTYIPPTYTTIPDPETGVPIQIETAPGSIRIDAIGGENLNDTCGCGQAYPTPTPIRSINGVTANPSGNLTLSPGGGHMTITPGANGLIIEDSSTEECCGCTELEDLTQQMVLLEDTILKLEVRQERLRESYDQFVTNVIGSLG